MACGDEVKTRMYRCFVPAVPGVWAASAHSNCVHNELAAMQLRTMGITPADPVGLHDMKRSMRRISNMMRKMQLQRWSLERVVNSYQGAMKRRYQEALESFNTAPELSKYDCRLSAFLKIEKFNSQAKISKPRMINCRSSRFNLLLASYLKPLEHALYKRWLVGYGGVRPTRCVGKGLNGPQRAALISRKMQDVGDCVVFEVDGKAFEAHVTREQLLVEHSVYKAAYPGQSELHNLLQHQLKLKGKTAGGIKFERDGCRASGDFNTGLGNTLVMGAVVDAAIDLASRDLGDFRATTLIDGDNALIFVERRVAGGLRAGFAGYVRAVSSHEMTVEKPTDILERVIFGQCQPVYNGEHYTMVREPYKTLSYSFSGYKHFNQPLFVGPMLKLISQAELTLARGIPVLEPYFSKALDKLSRYRDLQNPDFLEERLKYAVGDPINCVARGVCMEARRSFERAFGIGVEAQLELEKQLRACLDGLRVATSMDQHLEVVQDGDGPLSLADDDKNQVWHFLDGRDAWC
ncbi:RNA-dependent RNA polymerase [Botrytis cinerea umbra-like virus 1]|nr:RNA-dependent RNA polymerase [Botrytis cinerea umbra-like virus 1]